MSRRLASLLVKVKPVIRIIARAACLSPLLLVVADSDAEDARRVLGDGSDDEPGAECEEEAISARRRRDAEMRPALEYSSCTLAWHHSTRCDVMRGRRRTATETRGILRTEMRELKGERVSRRDGTHLVMTKSGVIEFLFASLDETSLTK